MNCKSNNLTKWEQKKKKALLFWVNAGPGMFLFLELFNYVFLIKIEPGTNN